MKTIHPFPARMAPDTITYWLSKLPKNSNVLDPMCGSGVVVRQALLDGHNSKGVDLDPLAVLMSRVWTRRINFKKSLEFCPQIVFRAKKLRVSETRLPWIDDCEETKQFVKYWFGPKQARELRKLSFALHRNEFNLSKPIVDIFWLALSKIIITKKSGASLAWDVSHSRPHRVKETNDYDVFNGFERAVFSIIKVLEAEQITQSAKVYRGDSRQLTRIAESSIDAIFSSPPYLNAIDYLRGHKLSLVWMGYSIPSLRQLRSTSVGAERAPSGADIGDTGIIAEAMDTLDATKMSKRHQSMLRRYAIDANCLINQCKRTLVPGGQLLLVLGDSCLNGHFVRNSLLFDRIAHKSGFVKTDEKTRKIEPNRRYLPSISKTNSLEKRMKQEVIQVYKLCI